MRGSESGDGEILAFLGYGCFALWLLISVVNFRWGLYFGATIIFGFVVLMLITGLIDSLWPRSKRD
jgi:hypothetical protein